MRELRHDFRATYHVAYEDVPADEAVDLIETLPAGSLWRSSLVEFGEWDEAREGRADVVDMLWKLMQLVATGSTEGAPQVTRPGDLRARRADAERAREVRERMRNTRWEEA